MSRWLKSPHSKYLELLNLLVSFDNVAIKYSIVDLLSSTVLDFGWYKHPAINGNAFGLDILTHTAEDFVDTMLSILAA